MSIPSGNVPSGGAFSSAVLAITDAIPFYDIGSVVQRISGVCSNFEGCPTEDELWGLEDGSDVASASEATPSEGTTAPPPPSADGTFESEVELIIGRNFGLPPAKSYMTTTCQVSEVLSETLTGADALREADSLGVGGLGSPRPMSAPGGPPSIDIELRVQTTAAKQSTLAAALPSVFSVLDQFAFPSGDALDAVAARSSRVRLRTTYLSPTLRISRPELDLGGAPSPGDAVFVYARE